MTNEIMKVTQDESGLEYIEIDNNLAEAKIALQGGHVVWWRPKSTAHDVLWLSTNARYEKGRSIRGGVLYVGHGLVSILLMDLFVIMVLQELFHGNLRIV